MAARFAAAGLEGDLAGPSLCVGFATVIGSEAAIMRHGHWKSVQIGRRYISQVIRWDDNPAG